jgi:hypothetical protein
MMPTKVSPCGRFVVLDGLHLDRNLFDALMRWAAEHELRVQDAIQFALCIFRDGTVDRTRAGRTSRGN